MILLERLNKNLKYEKVECPADLLEKEAKIRNLSVLEFMCLLQKRSPEYFSLGSGFMHGWVQWVDDEGETR